MRALLVVDVENDFMPFGALPVVDGDAVVAVANMLMPKFDLVVATQDWHPASHGSFASNQPGHIPGDVIELDGIPQVLWPDHCVQQMPGASFHSGLDVEWIDHVVRKGTDPNIDSYSAFYDNEHRKQTEMAAFLRSREVTDIVICGLTTDYCVRYSALDARSEGFGVAVVEDGVRAVDLRPGDGLRALDELRSAGCVILRSDQL